MNSKKDELDTLGESGLVIFDGEGLPVKADPSRHLREAEVCAVMLPYVMENIRISNRELARITGFDPRTIGRYRGGECFIQLLSQYVNKRMISVRAIAIDELEKGLLDNKMNANTKAKFIAISLAHTEKMAELLLLAKQKASVVTVNDILKELEEMDD